MKKDLIQHYNTQNALNIKKGKSSQGLESPELAPQDINNNNSNTVDHIATLNRMKQNATLLSFTLSGLKYSYQKPPLGAVKFNAFLYLARLALYQVLIVALQTTPIFLIILITAVESACLYSSIHIAGR